MKTVNVVLMGYGRVGKAFVRLVQHKRKVCANRYGFRLQLGSVFNSRGGLILPPDAEDEKQVSSLAEGSNLDDSPFWKPGRIIEEALEAQKAGVFVECTPSNIEDGEPALRFVHQAIDRGWHVVLANKGPLVVDFNRVRQKSEKKAFALELAGPQRLLSPPSMWPFNL